MQISDLVEEQKITPLWRLGFRPFFLFGSLFGVIAIIIWSLLLSSSWVHTPYGGLYWWHIHEMIFGFVMPIIAGFLLTAAQNWTGIRGAYGTTLKTLFFFWLFPRLFILMPEIIPQWLIIISDLAFLPAVALVLAKPIIAIRQYRNLFFIPLLVFFTLFNGLFHISIINDAPLNITAISYSGLLLICTLVSVMAGRVTPMFTANGTKTDKVAPLPLLEKIANGGLFILSLTMLISAFTLINNTLIATLFFITGISQLIRWLRWKPWITHTVPLLWSLHGAIKFMWLGLISLSFCYITPAIPKNHLWHLIAIGAIGGVILAMISRVSLGHTGRALCIHHSMSIAFLLISGSAIVRSIGPWINPENTQLFIYASGLMWIISFLVFLVNYYPMFTKARVDGRPG